MSKRKQKTGSKALGAVFVASLAASGLVNAENPFAMEELQSGYNLLAGGHIEGKCGAEAESDEGEGKCGEGKCGEGKCGEGKCGGHS